MSTNRRTLALDIPTREQCPIALELWQRLKKLERQLKAIEKRHARELEEKNHELMEALYQQRKFMQEIVTLSVKNRGKAKNFVKVETHTEETIRMFDQRGQKVHGDQMNLEVDGNMNLAGGDINFGDATKKEDMGPLLAKLLAALNKAAEEGNIDTEKAIDAEGPLKKAVIEARKPEAQKPLLLGYLDKAREALTGAVAVTGAASGLLTGIEQAKEAVLRLFGG
jgi:hypothetical protein